MLKTEFRVNISCNLYLAVAFQFPFRKRYPVRFTHIYPERNQLDPST